MMTPTDIHNICKQYNITNYQINPDMSIDVDGHVNLIYTKLTKLPLKFNKVSGHFLIDNNMLTTLEGCPHYVGLSFDCRRNQLSSLEHCPKYVGVGFYCYGNFHLYHIRQNINYIGHWSTIHYDRNIRWKV